MRWSCGDVAEEDWARIDLFGLLLEDRSFYYLAENRQ